MHVTAIKHVVEGSFHENFVYKLGLRHAGDDGHDLFVTPAQFRLLICTYGLEEGHREHMSNREIIEHLDRAAAEIILAEEKLNEDFHQCATCGLTVRHNFNEHQARARASLRAMRGKLDRFRGSFHKALMVEKSLPNQA